MIWAFLLHLYVGILPEYSSTQGSVVRIMKHEYFSIFVRLYLCGSVKSEYLYINVGIQLAKKDLEQLQQHITEESWYDVCYNCICVSISMIVVAMYLFVCLCGVSQCLCRHPVLDR